MLITVARLRLATGTQRFTLVDHLYMSETSSARILGHKSAPGPDSAPAPRASGVLRAGGGSDGGAPSSDARNDDSGGGVGCRAALATAPGEVSSSPLDSASDAAVSAAATEGRTEAGGQEELSLG